MTGPSLGLEVQLRKLVHPGLDLDVSIRLGVESGILFGASGAGKSTILRMIAGLERPDRGLVRLGDSTLFDSSNRIAKPLRTRRVGLIFQDDLLFPHLSVEQNVRFGLVGWSRALSDARVLEIARLCGIELLLNRRPGTLSGGERQRVGLARALAPRPKLLLCDEPVSALDLDARHAILDRLKVVQRLEAIPVLYVTHAIDEAIALGSRLFLLGGGQIKAEGPPLEVLGSAGLSRWPSIRNRFEATVEGQGEGQGLGETVLRLVDGPTLIIPALDRLEGSRVTVQVRSDDIVLALGSIEAISARNLVAGRVDRVVEHGQEAEVLVRTLGITWVVGVVSTALTALGLRPGVEVRMIIKARSCQVLGD